MTTCSYLIAYDIAEHRSRRRALRILRKVADSYQDSVFEVNLAPLALKQLQQQLYPLLADGDALFTLRLDSVQSWQLGTGMQPITGNIVVL